MGIITTAETLTIVTQHQKVFGVILLMLMFDGSIVHKFQVSYNIKSRPKPKSSDCSTVSTELASLDLGETVRVEVDYGFTLTSFKLTIESCIISNTNGESLTLVSNGESNPLLPGLVHKLISSSNHKDEFELKVFRLGDTNIGTFSCNLKIDQL